MPPREGPFWDVMEGRAAPPPVAQLLGFELLAIDPDVGRGRVVRRGRTIAHLAGELRREDGTVVASAIATAALQASRT